jgi:hypothetical protein
VRVCVRAQAYIDTYMHACIYVRIYICIYIYKSELKLDVSIVFLCDRFLYDRGSHLFAAADTESVEKILSS